MDKPISVGDLVVVVRGHVCKCVGFKNLGRIFQVSSMKQAEKTRCLGCKELTGAATLCFGDGNGKGYQSYRLKRIPPLGELESEKNDSKLAEPA